MGIHTPMTRRALSYLALLLLGVILFLPKDFWDQSKDIRLLASSWLGNEATLAEVSTLPPRA